MRALILTTIALTCLARASDVGAAEGEKPNVAVAKERLEKALANLKTAIAKIEQKKASDQDLKAALAALDPLKAALDAGNDVESQDLDYARLALTARKELRSQRERVEQRRLELALEVSREGIELAVVDLDGAMNLATGKEVADEAFDRARTALDEVSKALERARQWVGKNAEFDAYVKKVEAKVQSQRTSIDERQIGAAVARHRARLEPAYKTLTEAAAALKRKEAGEAEFVKVEAAATAAAKVLAEGKSLESKQKDYAAHAAKVGKEIESAKQQVDAKRTELASAKHKEEIEAVRAALADSVSALGRRDPSDDLFIEAEKAADLLRRQLDAVAALPAKSPAFVQYVVDTKRSLAATQVDLQKRRIAVQLPRQRRKIEDGRAALAKALAALQGSEVTAAEFAAVEAAAKSVELALQDGVALEKEREYGTYAREVRKRVEEARARSSARRDELRVAAQKAEIQSARASLAGAIKRINGREPDQAEFDEARTAATVLEKTIEAAAAVETKDARFASYLTESKQAVTAARRTIEERKVAVEIALQRARVNEALAEVKASLAALPLSAEVKAAEATAAALEKAIEAGAQYAAKEREYASFAAAARKSAADARQRIEARRLEMSVSSETAAIERLLAAANGSVESTKLDTAGAKQLEQAAASLKAAEEEVAMGAALEKRDRSFASFAAGAKTQLAQLRQELEVARQMIAFRSGPVAALAEGTAAAEAGGRATELSAQRDAYAKALARFKACQAESADLLAEHPRIANTEFGAGESRISAKNVVSTCSAQAESTTEKLTYVTAVLAVYEGPAKSFEAAKGLIDKAAATSADKRKGLLKDALVHLESCLEKGKILQYKHPKLGALQFDVAGRKLALAGLVGECQQRATSIRSGK